MSRDILSRPAPPPDHTARYGDRPEQVADLRLPRGAADTLVVLIHGGFWSDRYDRAHVGPLADALARAGYAVVVPEYRRIGPSGGGWPGTFDDIATFCETLGAISAAHGIRPRRTVLLGHSAGGQLALWAAARHRLPIDCGWHSSWRPDGVVSLAGCNSLELTDAWGLEDGVAARLLDGGPDRVPGRYALADPMALLPLGVPVTLLHGTEDVQVPLAMSRVYAERAESAGDSVKSVEFLGLDHFDLIDPESVVWPDLLSALEN